MRHITRKLTLLAATLMIFAVPAHADEDTVDRTLEQGQQVEKNECLLVSKNCANEVDTIQQRIDRIQKEISRGSDVYTNDELRKLDRELEKANKTLEGLSLGG